MSPEIGIVPGRGRPDRALRSLELAVTRRLDGLLQHVEVHDERVS